MTLTVVNQGEEQFLEAITANNMNLRLYTNDATIGLTPSEIQALTQADFDEATFPGYTATTIGGGAWTITQGDPSTAVDVEHSFQRSSTGTPENIWGYWVTDGSSGDLLWFEQFPGPIVVEFLNDEIQVTPRITLDDQGGSEMPIGSITAWGATTAPANHLLCQGQAVPRSIYPLLFAVIGETYGPGDGSTTFNVPNLKQRFPLGRADSGTGTTLGTTGGAIDHTHGLDSPSSAARISLTGLAGSEAVIRRKTVGSWTATHRLTDATFGTSSTGATTGAELTGVSGTANPPYQVVNFIIRAR